MERLHVGELRRAARARFVTERVIGTSRNAALGFGRKGREWVLPGSEIAFEAPGEALEPGDEAELVELASGRQVLVLSLEDLPLWRLREWIH